MRLMGSIWIHLLCVSWHSLVRVLLRVWLALSTFPKTWGHQDEWKWYLIPKHAGQFWDIVAINEGPLSLWSDWGSPNLGTVSFSRALQASVALSVLVRNVSVHLVNVSIGKSLQSCPTLCDPIDGSPPASPIPGILQAGTLEWVAISFSNAWKWKVKVKSLSRVPLFATPWTAAYQAPPSMGFSRQEYWSGVPLPSPECVNKD